MISDDPTSSPVSASTFRYLIRPVFLLIWLKLIFLSRCWRETEQQDTIPARVLGSLSNTHAGPRHTPYKRATPHRWSLPFPMHRGCSRILFNCVANLFGSRVVQSAPVKQLPREADHARRILCK